MFIKLRILYVILSTVRFTTVVVGRPQRYFMQIDCHGCCIAFNNGGPPFRKVCDIKGSLATTFPILVNKTHDYAPPVELFSNFKIYENSTFPKPAASFRIGEIIFGDKIDNEILTQLQSIEGPSKLKVFVQFPGAQMAMRCRGMDVITSGKLQSASIKAIMG
jgi:hypothetical protein